MPTKYKRPTEADKLIYQNSNMYRIHADNLRWSLLAGFAVFLGAVAGLSQSSTSTIKISDPLVSLLAFILSFSYFWILAFQNWFYNMFARWVDDCESNLIQGRRLRTMKEFAQEFGAEITPFHPAFILAEGVVGLVAYYFIANSIITGAPIQLEATLKALSLSPASGWFLGLLLYTVVLNVFFIRWDRMIYKPIIIPVSNLFKQSMTRSKKKAA